MVSERTKVFISYSHDSEEHRARVRALADRLRRGGIDCTVDQYDSSPPEGWPAWMRGRLDESDFILVVCTEGYFRRLERKEPLGVGHGALFEGRLIEQLLYEQGMRNERVVPVLFDDGDSKWVPRFLASYTRFQVDTEANYAALYRLLTRQPAVIKPDMGPLMVLPPAGIESSYQQGSRTVADRAIRTGLGGRIRRQRWLLPSAAVLLAGLGLARWMITSDRERQEPMPSPQSLAEVDRNEEAAQDLYRKGLDALRNLDAPEARRHLEEALRYADRPEIHSAFAEALVMLGMDDLADEEAKKALDQVEKLPSQERLLVEARCLKVLGEWDQAINRYQQLHQSYPEKAEYALGVAEAQMENGSLQEAFEAVEAMKKTWVDPRLDLLEARIAFKSADCTRQHNAASRVAKQARTSKLDLMRAEALIQRGLALHCLNKTSEALNDFDEAAALSALNRKQTARAQNARGGVLYESGHLSEARQSFEEALKGYEQLKDEESIAAQHLNIAVIFSEEGKLANAENEYKKAIKVFHEQGHRTEEAFAIGNLGLVVANQGRIGEATSYMQSAVELIRGQDSQKEALQLCNIAWVRRENLELRTAAASLDQCLKLANEIQDERLKADALFEQGNLLIYLDKLDGAEERHRRALKMREELEDQRSVAESLLALAEIHLERNSLPEASSFAERALRQFQKERMPDRKAMAEVVLARVHLKRRELDKARSAIERAQGRADRSEVFELRVRAALGEAQILAATGALNKARDLLEARLAETRQRQHAALERQVRFALAELELLHGNRGRGRELLSQVEEDSRVRGYHLIAVKAARLLADS